MERERDDEGGPWKRRASLPDPKSRKWMSSTAASLLDNEDEAVDEPDLLSVSIDSGSNLSEKLNAIDPRQIGSDTVSSSVVRLTEGMTGMLCSASLEGPDPIMTMALNGNHRRIDSDTEIFQKDLATGHCGTAPFCMPSKQEPTRSMEKTLNESLTMLDRIDSLNHVTSSVFEDSSIALGRSDTLKKVEPTCGAQFNLLDLQHLVATDIIEVLGSSTGVASEWFATLGEWLVPTSHESQKLPRRVFRNRCSVRKAQSHRLKELWYKWHSNASDDASSRHEYSSIGI